MANMHQLSDSSIFNPNRLAGFVQQLENTVLKQPVFVQLGRHLLKANLVYWDSSPGEVPKRNQHGINQKQNKLQVHTSNTSNTQHTSKKYRTSNLQTNSIAKKKHRKHRKQIFHQSRFGNNGIGHSRKQCFHIDQGVPG